MQEKKRLDPRFLFHSLKDFQGEKKKERKYSKKKCRLNPFPSNFSASLGGEKKRGGGGRNHSEGDGDHGDNGEG